MVEKEKAIKALELFNEKAEEILSSTFFKKILEDGIGVTLNWNYETGEEITNFERKGPDKENIKAVVLDFRFFIQNNDKISFRNLKELYSSSLLNAKFESRFDSARDALNNHLDSHGKFQLEYNGEILTRRKIIDTLFMVDYLISMKTKKNYLKNGGAYLLFFL